jgi:hypothetical protein
MDKPEIVLECGNCAWMQKVETPPEKKKDYPHGRGYCTFNPPAVFPVPQQSSNLRNIQGQAQVGFAPFMLRPVVDGNEPACGRYNPDSEMMKLLQESQPEGCEEFGCGRPGGCDCGSE